MLMYRVGGTQVIAARDDIKAARDDITADMVTSQLTW